eukprot:CAMPEP_0196742182 /NCGR_PEP_ID=MMETSP1091-20130531/45118_1 /TAXON_ID=302021 /ORGANISM="Rhodomonas sp., Strain CCMP768" /LENGTH=154 /DNA_ID=CAMNT_0042088151 /DNA_START=22 /DNA_END=486 /DNA_ORIENTATION=+
MAHEERVCEIAATVHDKSAAHLQEGRDIQKDFEFVVWQDQDGEMAKTENGISRSLEALETAWIRHNREFEALVQKSRRCHEKGEPKRSLGPSKQEAKAESVRSSREASRRESQSGLFTILVLLLIVYGCFAWLLLKAGPSPVRATPVHAIHTML